jgi:hypothetical protein
VWGLKTGIDGAVKLDRKHEAVADSIEGLYDVFDPTQWHRCR